MSAEGGLKDKREKEEGIMSHGFRKKHTHDLEKTSKKSNGFLLVATSMHRF